MDSEIDRSLRSIAQALSAHVTVVDYHGLLHDSDHEPVIGVRWQSHRTCTACDKGFGPACIAHCRWQVGERLAQRPEPYVTNCWQGLRELALPLESQGSPIGTLFIGTWRSPVPPSETSHLGKTWRQAWDQLPVYDEAKVADLIPLANLLASGLSKQITNTISLNAAHQDLRTTIMMFVRLHGSLPIQLADLAEHLNRSVSRTGALVREIFDQPFSALLRQTRIDGAKNLLQRHHLPVSDVARAVGYEDPLYFSRSFKTVTGLSPRAWRQQQTTKTTTIDA